MDLNSPQFLGFLMCFSLILRNNSNCWTELFILDFFWNGFWNLFVKSMMPCLSKLKVLPSFCLEEMQSLTTRYTFRGVNLQKDRPLETSAAFSPYFWNLPSKDIKIQHGPHIKHFFLLLGTPNLQKWGHSEARHF